MHPPPTTTKLSGKRDCLMRALVTSAVQLQPSTGSRKGEAGTKPGHTASPGGRKGSLLLTHQHGCSLSSSTQQAWHVAFWRTAYFVKGDVNSEQPDKGSFRSNHACQKPWLCTLTDSLCSVQICIRTKGQNGRVLRRCNTQVGFT